MSHPLLPMSEGRRSSSESRRAEGATEAMMHSAFTSAVAVVNGHHMEGGNNNFAPNFAYHVKQDNFDSMDRMRWSSRSGATKGPKRLCAFCLFAILLPFVLVCIPLYVRFQALRPHVFTLSPSDMKLLNHESRVSTVWCEQQTLLMNASFNAYLLERRPRLERYRHHVNMHRRMMLEDDIKEYWGFYLLRGSVVRLSVCSRHEGASFIIVKGLKDARRCSFLGELDSAEESDEISDEFEFSHEISVLSDTALNNRMRKADGQSNSRSNSTASTPNASSIDAYLQSFDKLSKHHKTELVRKLLKSLHQDPKSEEVLSANQNVFEAFQVETAEEAKMALENNVVKKEELEELDEIDMLDTKEPEEVIYDLFDQGRFNQSNANDSSNEEVRSSWSSSEEALAACEGLIYNVPLNGNIGCRVNATTADLERVSTEVSLEVEETGFYYFIFANENEITVNFLSARFDLHKTVFDVASSIRKCTNTTECTFPLHFWSHEHVVLEVPDDHSEDNKTCDALMGFSSLDECHTVVVAHSVCQPRKVVYMAFLLVVPILILIFAYI